MPSDWRSPAVCLESRLAPGDRLVDVRRTERCRSRVRRHRASLLPDVSRLPRVLDGLLLRRNAVAETACGAGRPPEQPVRHRQSGVVARALEDAHRAGDLLLDPLTAPFAGVARTQADEQPDERRAGRAAPVRLPRAEHASSSTSSASSNRPVRRSASPCSGSRPSRSGWSRGRRAAARPSNDAALGMSPRANARRPAEARRRDALLADLPSPLVERAELGEVPPGLLEVVAEDLLELDPAVAIRLVGPRDESRVEVRPRALQDAVVRGVADHDVLEPVRAVGPVLDAADEMLLREGRQLGPTRGETSGGARAVTASSAKT